MEIDKLVEDNISLVYYQLHKQGMAYDEDAISAAMEGLVVAANTYDTSKDIKFSTYAAAVIYNRINHYLRSKNAKKRIATIISFDEPVYDLDDTTVEDTIGDDRYAPDVVVTNKELLEVLNKAFIKVYDALPNKASKDIIKYWQQSDYAATQMELAAKANVSQAHVSRTISAFKHKLKQKMEEYLC